MTAAAWGQLLIAVAVVAGLPATYALRRNATLPGMVTLAAVLYGLFVLWLGLSVVYVSQVAVAFGGVSGAIWPAVAVAAGMAVVSGVACWLGWRAHTRLHPTGPLGEQARQPDSLRSQVIRRTLDS